MKIDFDVSDIVIETERLVLRAWQTSDLEDLFEYASMEGVGDMAGWPPHTSIVESEKVLRNFIDEKNVFAVTLKTTKKVIGSIALHGSWAHKEKKYDHLKIAELGYVLSKAYWSKGLMTEAARALISYSFDVMNYDALTVCHFIDNFQSERVIQKCGFQFMQIDKFFSKKSNLTYNEKQYILFKQPIPEFKQTMPNSKN